VFLCFFLDESWNQEVGHEAYANLSFVSSCSLFVREARPKRVVAQLATKIIRKGRQQMQDLVKCMSLSHSAAYTE
jgi:hypothetical protein